MLFHLKLGYYYYARRTGSENKERPYKLRKRKCKVVAGNDLSMPTCHHVTVAKFFLLSVYHTKYKLYQTVSSYQNNSNDILGH